MSVNVPSRLLRYSALGLESFATYTSTQPSPSKSSVATPNPYVSLARVIVVVPDTRRLTPPARRESGARRHILERAVPLVAVQVIGRLLPFGKSLESGAVDEEDVDPAVRVVVDGRCAAAGCFDQVLVGALPPVDGPSLEARLTGHVGKGEPQRIIPGARRGSGGEHARRDNAAEERGPSHLTALRCSHTVSTSGGAPWTVAMITWRDCSAGKPAAAASSGRLGRNSLCSSTPPGDNIAEMFASASISSTSSKYGRMFVAMTRSNRSPSRRSVTMFSGSARSMAADFEPTVTVFARWPAGAFPPWRIVPTNRPSPPK